MLAGFIVNFYSLICNAKSKEPASCVWAFAETRQHHGVGLANDLRLTVPAQGDAGFHAMIQWIRLGTGYGPKFATILIVTATTRSPDLTPPCLLSLPE